MTSHIHVEKHLCLVYQIKAKMKRISIDFHYLMQFESMEFHLQIVYGNYVKVRKSRFDIFRCYNGIRGMDVLNVLA